MNKEGLIENYARLHSDAEPECLRRIERLSNTRLMHGRMCSGHLQGRLLKMLTEMVRPQLVVELGTFSAYSAICIAQGLGSGARLITIEHNDELEDFIRERLSESGVEDKVELRIGDAMERLAEFEEASVDMMFIDADKRAYPCYYEEALRVVRPGGFIIADNTLWDGHVVDSAYDRDPQTIGIRSFNDMVAADPRVEKVMLPLRDGLTLIRVSADAPQGFAPACSPRNDGSSAGTE